MPNHFDGTGPSDPMDRHVGQRIWRRRRELGLSRRALGERIGVGLKQVNKYETGENRVSAGRLHEIGTALGVDAGWFFEEFNGATHAGALRGASRNLPADTGHLHAFLEVYHTVPPRVRGRFLRLVRAIADSAAGER